MVELAFVSPCVVRCLVKVSNTGVWSIGTGTSDLKFLIKLFFLNGFVVVNSCYNICSNLLTA